VPHGGWDDALWNRLLAGAGNLVGAVVLVATSCWYLFLKDQPDKAATPSPSPLNAPDAGRVRRPAGDSHRPPVGAECSPVTAGGW
jgi:hypothetical protein